MITKRLKMFLRCSVKNIVLLCVLVILLILGSLMTDIPMEKRSDNTYHLDSYTSNISSSTVRNNHSTNFSVVRKSITVKNLNQKDLYSHPYKYINTPSKTCNHKGSKTDPFLLIIIKSNVRNMDNRIAIRSTWGNISDPSVRVVFLLGFSPFLEKFIRMEQSMYDDIIQEDFLDNYNNNTLKTIMGYNWSVTNCKNTKYLFFVDDDYLVNVRLLLDVFRKRLPSSIFTGCVWYNAKPNRNVRRKWYVSIKEYPDKHWPPYATGGSILMTYDYANKMKEGFKSIKPLYIDDVYLGIVAKKLNIPLTNDGRFHPYYNLGRIHQMYSIHNFQSPNKLVEDWKKLRSILKA
ncbi:beta-1,3-galactosyltransferase 1-like [Mytilus galloprovincialis]|uniref:beta-1,3-galactosyltransferase 1-like n=1 Tax=Mytilus galloprovincialis TaxID=29158 RepID=UPI003F7C6283